MREVNNILRNNRARTVVTKKTEILNWQEWLDYELCDWCAVNYGALSYRNLCPLDRLWKLLACTDNSK
jgi:hypothetical protein